MSIEVGLTEPQPLEVTFEEICAGVEVSVDSNPVVVEFPTPPEIQVALNEVYQTNGGGGSGKSPYVGGNGNWFYYNDVTQQYIDSGVKAQGNPGKTAYQSAVDGGYTNTEPQFNTDLSQVNNKVDKVAGKGLSTNDFTNTLKGKLDSTEIFTAAEKTQGALATGVANPSPLSGKDITTLNKLATEFDIEINNKAEEDGTILYHSKPWTTGGDISITGNIVTGTGTAFTSAMVGAKLKLSSGWYAIITNVTSATNIHINKNVDSTITVVNGYWGIYNKAFATQDSLRYIAAYLYNNATPSYYVDQNNNFVSASQYALYSKLQFNAGLKAGNTGNNPPIWLGVTSKITWAGGNVDVEIGTKDLGITRNSTGKLEINDGNTAGMYRDLILRNLEYTGGLTNASDERLKTGFSDVTNATNKVLTLSECVKHYFYKDQESYAAGKRTGFIANLLKEKGFDGHVIERLPKDESEGVMFGWAYKDEEYEETKEQGEIEVNIRRVVDKQGDMVLQVENNFVPYLCCAFAELYNEHEQLKQRLINIEKSLGL